MPQRPTVDHAAIAAAAFFASLITFFSGFGLGTVLLPVFAAFLPLPAAIATAAVVHFLNNALKGGLLRRQVAWPVFRRFGLPALAAAPLGALALDALAGRGTLASYAIGRTTYRITALNLVIACLLIVFAVQEARPQLGRFAVSERLLPLGGVASGFLGGLAGLQGALRSAFLLRAGIGRDAFIATGVAVALAVDAARLVVYGAQGTLSATGGRPGLLVAGLAGASAGTIAGARLLRRTTIRAIQIAVGALLVAVAVALALGLV